ncbi:hypothetical protein HYDPIDRAFT_185128 [Hydnomerulius pinastri MD-312]|nr:hypothetical protein HYDPIDRAFT_185128 [Hydnomerulius pinastri MD-312]
MLSSEVKISPVKGKARDDGRWRANWWDFHPLVENIQRPVVWSNSSTIFTAHPTQPIILGRLFPSSKQFIVASPDPVLRSPQSYEPPSTISVSPNDHWLFAFYPGREGDGIACLWKRGLHVDSWLVTECWPFSRGGGVVTAAWAGAEREWSTSSDSSSYRLPFRGPLTPVSNPTLLLVTQAHQLHVCYLRTYVPSLKVLFCSLTQPYLTIEGQVPGAVHDTPAGPKTSRLCTHASIGFVYNESSILIAMRSQRYPTSDSLKPAAYHDLDLELSLDLPHPQDPSPEEQSPPLEWGALAEEPTIELCEVKLRFDGVNMNLRSHPLPPLHHPTPHLTGLMFVCTPPPKLDPTTSPQTSPKKDKQPPRPVIEPSSTYLVASFLDFDNYSTVPKSEMIVYTLARVPPSGSPVKVAWSTRQVGERSFFPRVLTLSAPGWVPTNVKKAAVVALLADTGGPVSRGGQKVKEVAVGNITVLQLPDLTDDPDWERPTILAPVSRAGMDWPVSIAMSRNRALLCTVTLCRTSIHALPKQIVKSTEPGDLPQNIPPLSMALTSALQSRRSIADIAHVLSMAATPVDAIVDTLNGAWLAFDSNARAGMAGSVDAMEVLRAAVEIYRTRARQTTNDDEKERLSSLWKNVHDICSIAACLAAFEDCREPEGYDLEAVWQLVSISGWVVSFLENLVKECLSLADLMDVEPTAKEVQPKAEPVDDTDPFLRDDIPRARISSPFDSPILLHIVHPLTLTNLVGVTFHVNRFYNSLSSLTAKGENSQIARDILLDLIGCSGLNLKGLEDVFKGALLDLRSIPGDELKLSLAKCHPVPAQHAPLRKIIQTLYSSTSIDKPRLFIKPADLVDGFTSLSMSDHPQKDQDRDVVTKGLLLRRGPGLVCLRCGHRSEVGGEVSVAGHISLRWRSWEKMWMSRCVCGGAWASGII